MQMFAKFVVAAVSAVALGCVLGCVPGCAQSDPTPSAGTTPTAKITPPEASNLPAVQESAAPATVPESTPAAPKPGPQVIEDAPAAVKTAPETTVPETKAPEPAKNTAAATTDPRSAPYTFGPLDVIVVKVWNNQPLSGVYDVHQDGIMSMPLIGDIKADGLTQSQLTEIISKKLGDCCLKTPVVNVELGKNNSKRYFVYGEVGHAGDFPLVRATTVMDALSDVGGFRDFANQKKIRILRILPSGEPKTYIFNYKDVSHGKNMQENILLQPGDRIYVD
jgi:polysaccharide export outer membrane protein